MAPQTASVPTALTANAFTRTGYNFTGWNTKADGSGTAYADGAIYDFAADVTLYAQWAIKTYTITASAGANGTIAPSGAVTVNQGVSQAFTITPASGYQVDDVKVDGNSVGAVTSYTFTNVQDNHTIAATFKAISTSRTLTYTAGPNGSITGQKVQTVNHGGSGAAVTAVANPGYHFVKWSDGLLTPSRTDTNVQADLSVTAWFVLDAKSLIAWGNNTYGQTTVPTGNNFVAIAANYYHNLALRSDGSVVAWGITDGSSDNDHGQVTGAPSAGDFVAVSAGFRHSLALRSDGSLLAWGSNENRQVIDTPTGNDFVAISAGGRHSLALKSDGSLVAWGFNDDGQVSGTPTGNDFIAIAAGGYHNLALKSDGSLVAWGRTDQGQCNVPAPNTGFVAIAAGYAHSLALKSDGSVVAWGLDDNNQVSGKPAGIGFKTVAAGFYYSLALKSDGSLVAWGQNDHDQIGVPAGTGFVAVDGGYWHGVALGVQMSNHPPVVGTVAITPDPAYPGTRSFTATPAGFTDPDGDTLTYHYVWTLNDDPVGGDSNTISLTVKNGDVVAVSVTASDGIASSGAATASVTVGLFPVNYRAGWNLVAGGPNSDFAGLTLYHYNNASGIYNPLTEDGMQHAFGYWLWLEEALTAYLNVTNPPLTYQLGAGWNLIGNSTAVPLNLPEGKYCYVYNGSIYNSADQLQPGEGAWFWSDEAGSIQLTASGS